MQPVSKPKPYGQAKRRMLAPVLRDDQIQKRPPRRRPAVPDDVAIPPPNPELAARARAVTGDDFASKARRPSGDLACWSWLCHVLYIRRTAPASPTLRKSSKDRLAETESTQVRLIEDIEAEEAARKAGSEPPGGSGGFGGFVVDAGPAVEALEKRGGAGGSGGAGSSGGAGGAGAAAAPEPSDPPGAPGEAAPDEAAAPSRRGTTEEYGDEFEDETVAEADARRQSETVGEAPDGDVVEEAPDDDVVEEAPLATADSYAEEIFE